MFKRIPFYKYQGTGNDFVIIDNRFLDFKNDTKLIKQLCDRKFGIGADGLICLERHPHKDVDFKMKYYNADGNESSMCGNGGRCIVAFAKYLDIIKDECIFEAIDGLHKAKINDDLQVELKMLDVEDINTYADDYVIDTGSPHYIKFVENTNEINVPKQGAEIRYSRDFSEEGINVNFVEVKDDLITMRTYERGVEDETLSCGTGVTAVALAVHHNKMTTDNLIKLNTSGGQLKIRLTKTDLGYQDIWLIGPTQQVFKGEIKC